MTLNIMDIIVTLSIIGSLALSIMTLNISIEWHYAECHYAESRYAYSSEQRHNIYVNFINVTSIL
jgi:hypothetical protein